MNLDTLKNAGLADGEIKIYETLLENGGQTAGNIIALSKLKRGDCYNKIYDLIGRGLVIESTKNKKKFFELASPDTIESYIEKQIENLTATQKEIKSILPNIISSYNLSYHKPGVKFFEGEESFAKMMGDSLTAKEEIYSYVDPGAIDQYIDDLNKKYLRSSAKAGVKKKIIVEDNSFNRNRYHKLKMENTEVRYIHKKMPPFSTTVQIYDNKVTYHTIKPEAIIGIIIEDKLIYSLHRALFEYTWSTAKD